MEGMYEVKRRKNIVDLMTQIGYHNPGDLLVLRSLGIHRNSTGIAISTHKQKIDLPPPHQKSYL